MGVWWGGGGVLICTTSNRQSQKNVSSRINYTQTYVADIRTMYVFKMNSNCNNFQENILYRSEVQRQKACLRTYTPSED